MTNLLLVGILSLNFIFEVQLERLILHLDVLNLTLKLSHRSLLAVQFSVHLLDSLALFLLDMIHAGHDVRLSLVQLLVLFLQVCETVLQRIYRVLLAIIDIFIV